MQKIKNYKKVIKICVKNKKTYYFCHLKYSEIVLDINLERITVSIALNVITFMGTISCVCETCDVEMCSIHV